MRITQSSMIEIRAIHPTGEQDCEAILRALPGWFGIESSLLEYVADTRKHPTWLAWETLRSTEPRGFITIRRHFPRSAEVHCIAVAPGIHRRGVGRALVTHVENLLRRDGVQFLQVKTLGPSRPDANYERTRLFYEGLGFVPLEEFLTLWPGNPALQMVKLL